MLGKAAVNTEPDVPYHLERQCSSTDSFVYFSMSLSLSSTVPMSYAYPPGGGVRAPPSGGYGHHPPPPTTAPPGDATQSPASMTGPPGQAPSANRGSFSRSQVGWVAVSPFCISSELQAIEATRLRVLLSGSASKALASCFACYWNVATFSFSPLLRLGVRWRAFFPSNWSSYSLFYALAG